MTKTSIVRITTVNNTAGCMWPLGRCLDLGRDATVVIGGLQPADNEIVPRLTRN